MCRRSLSAFSWMWRHSFQGVGEDGESHYARHYWRQHRRDLLSMNYGSDKLPTHLPALSAAYGGLALGLAFAIVRYVGDFVCRKHKTSQDAALAVSESDRSSQMDEPYTMAPPSDVETGPVVLEGVRQPTVPA